MTDAATRAAPIDQRSDPRKWRIMWVLGAVAFMAQLDFFIVNVALDGIGASFPGSGAGALSWVLNAYAIVFAAVLVPAGRIADLWGRKKVLLVGVGIFTLASLIASLAPALGVLVAARAVQAVGAAMIVPTSLGLLYPNFPKRQHTLVVGLWAGVAGCAGVVGMLGSAVLQQFSDWRVICWALGAAAVAVAAMARAVPRSRDPEAPPVDWPGSATSGDFHPNPAANFRTSSGLVSVELLRK